jgi:hypothetical protein
MAAAYRPPEERFWEKVDKDGPIPSHRPELGPCWVWTAGKSNGYGMFRLSRPRRQIWAHIFTTPNCPVGLERDHLCRNRSCVRETHIEFVTSGENTLRGTNPAAVNAKKTQCPRGHELDGDNLYVRPNGARECRKCKTGGAL